MVTAAKPAYGTLLKRNGTLIPGVEIGPSGPSRSMDAIQATSHDSASGYKEFIGGLIDAGSVPFSIQWDPDNAQHTGLLTDMNARTVQTFALTYPDTGATIVTFTALVVKHEPDAPVEGKLMMACELKVSGLPVYS